MSKHAGRRAEVSRDRKSGSSGTPGIKGQPPTSLEKRFVIASQRDIEASLVRGIRQRNFLLGEERRELAQIVAEARQSPFQPGSPFFEKAADFKKMTDEENRDLRRVVTRWGIAVLCSFLGYACIEQALPSDKMREIAQPFLSEFGFLMGVAGLASIGRRISPACRARDASLKKVDEFCKPLLARDAELAAKIREGKETLLERKFGLTLPREKEPRFLSMWRPPVAMGTCHNHSAAKGSIAKENL